MYFTLGRIDTFTVVNLHGIYFFYLLDYLLSFSVSFCYFTMKVLDIFSQIYSRVFNCF